MSSTLSLPGLRDDMSPIRPTSSMSNYSISSVRSHKKRRAPPPPVQLSVKTIPEENMSEKVVERVPSPVPSNASIITSFEVAQGDTSEETLHHKSPGFEENPESEDKRQMYAKVNKVKTNEVTPDDNYNSSVDGEFEIHESIIICEENEPDNHVYETVEIKKELNVNEDHAIRDEYRQEKTLNEVDAPENSVKPEKIKKEKRDKEIIIGEQDQELNQAEGFNTDGEVVKEKKKKKKKDKERDKSLENEEEHKKKKKKKHKHKSKDDEVLQDEKLDDIPPNLIKTNDVEEKGSSTHDDRPQFEISPLEIKRNETTDNNNETTESVIETTLQGREKQINETRKDQNKFPEKDTSFVKKKKEWWS